MLAGFDLAAPQLPLATDAASLLRVCTEVLAQHYAMPGGAVMSASGGLLAGLVVWRTAAGIGRQLWISSRQRHRQRWDLALIGRPGMSEGSLVVDSPAAAVYCLPGRHPVIVFTSAALSRLDQSQMAAVLAHEQLHQRARHDLVLSMARGLERAFPFLALFRTAHGEILRLVEMHADDVAAKQPDRRVVVTALCQLAESRAPSGSLGAGGTSTLRRVTRLAAPAHPLPRCGSMAVSLAVVAMSVLPLVLIALPALSALAVEYCPLNSLF